MYITNHKYMYIIGHGYTFTNLSYIDMAIDIRKGHKWTYIGHMKISLG